MAVWGTGGTPLEKYLKSVGVDPAKLSPPPPAPYVAQQPAAKTFKPSGRVSRPSTSSGSDQIKARQWRQSK